MHPLFGKGKRDSIYAWVEADKEYGGKVYRDEMFKMPALTKKIRELSSQCINTEVKTENPSDKIKVIIGLPSDFGPLHKDWDNPGKSSWRQKWLRGNDPEYTESASMPAIKPAPKTRECEKCIISKGLGQIYCGWCGRKIP